MPVSGKNWVLWQTGVLWRQWPNDSNVVSDRPCRSGYAPESSRFLCILECRLAPGFGDILEYS